MSYSVRSSVDYGNAGSPRRESVGALQTIADTKPWRWISGHIGRKEAIPRDLVTQQQYVGEASDPLITESAQFPGREVVDFSGDPLTGIKIPGCVPATLRSFSFFLHAEVLGDMSDTRLIFQMHNGFSADNGFVLNWLVLAVPVFQFRINGSSTANYVQNAQGYDGGTGLSVGDTFAIAGTFNNSTKKLSLYENDMGSPVAAKTTGANSREPSDHQFYIGTPYIAGIVAAPFGVANLIIWPREVTSAELVAVKAASDAIEGV